MRPPKVEMIRREVAAFTKRKIKAGQFGKDFSNITLLRTKTANEWMKQEYGKPAARSLFGSFWYEGELCILFADTNLGKSILAVQIGDCLTKACSFEPFYNQIDTVTPVLYIDFELSAKQFEARYVDGRWGSYLFSPKFFRSEFNAEADDPVIHDDYEDYVQDSIDTAILDTGARVLIIDNITYMRRGTQSSNEALPLMKALKALKTRHRLSVLVLAHTPKRNAQKPLTVNDLQGSKMLINFADSAFAIGKSYMPHEPTDTGPPFRYLKQIKQRNQKEEYGENNICLIRLEKHLNLLRYRFEGYAVEHDHLRRRHDDDENEELKLHIAELHRQGRSRRQIAEELKVSLSKVNRVAEKIKEKV